MSSEEGEEVQSSPLYKDNEAWKDVTPIYHSAAEESVVKIAYSETFRDAFAYLRAVLQTKEMSKRAFMLTEDCINLNPANYTVWEYRRELLKSLDLDLDKELTYLDGIIMDTPKNYQVWHHRRTIVGWIGAEAVPRELAFTETVLADECKNYHAWMHRQWVVRSWPDEIDVNLEMSYALKLIVDDSRNNSAWNYRYYIASTRGLLAKDAAVEVEINLCKRFVEKMPNNESVWNYLAGILMEKGLNSNADVVNFVEELYKNATTPNARSPYLIQFIANVLLESLENGLAVDAEATSKRAKELFTELSQVDPTRINYWNYQIKHAENLFQKFQTRVAAN